jgi:hypothetical protein
MEQLGQMKISSLAATLWFTGLSFVLQGSLVVLPLWRGPTNTTTRLREKGII